jgi:hypothetical protein
LLLDSAGTRDIKESVYASLFVAKDFSYTVFLGYTYGENPLSYPPPTKGQARAVLAAAAEVCDVVIVSAPTAFCASALAMAAAAASDLSVCVVSPGIRSLTYLSSNRRVYPDRTVPPGREDEPAVKDSGHILVCNHPDGQAGASVPARADFLLPFSVEIGEQGRERRLLEPVRSRDGMAYQHLASDIYDGFVFGEVDADEG